MCGCKDCKGITLLKGADGVGIVSITDNGDGTFTILLSNGTTFISPDYTGPTGSTGPTGPAGTNGTNGTDGVGIDLIEWTSNSEGQPQGTAGTTDTYTITLTDLSTYDFLVTNGENGDQGIYGGFSSDWSFSTTIGGVPTVGSLQFNNASYASVTRFEISYTSQSALNVTDMLSSFLNGGNYGYVRVFKRDDSSIFWMGKIIGLTDMGTHYRVDVEYIMHSGTFTLTPVVLTFAPSGDGQASIAGWEQYQTSGGNQGLTLAANKKYYVHDFLSAPANSLTLRVPLTNPVLGDKIEILFGDNPIVTNAVYIRLDVDTTPDTLIKFRSSDGSVFTADINSPTDKYIHMSGGDISGTRLKLTAIKSDVGSIVWMVEAPTYPGSQVAYSATTPV